MFRLNFPIQTGAYTTLVESHCFSILFYFVFYMTLSLSLSLSLLAAKLCHKIALPYLTFFQRNSALHENILSIISTLKKEGFIICSMF